MSFENKRTDGLEDAAFVVELKRVHRNTSNGRRGVAYVVVAALEKWGTDLLVIVVFVRIIILRLLWSQWVFVLLNSRTG